MRPVRKRNRLASYDYSACGTYFITICTAGREKWLWSSEDAGAAISRPHAVPLSDAGRTADDAINAIPLHYSTVRVDHYVIMPNHIHLLLTLLPADGRLIAAPYALAGCGTIETDDLHQNRQIVVAEIVS